VAQDGVLLTVPRRAAMDTARRYSPGSRVLLRAYGTARRGTSYRRTVCARSPPFVVPRYLPWRSPEHRELFLSGPAPGTGRVGMTQTRCLAAILAVDVRRSRLKSVGMPGRPNRERLLATRPRRCSVPEAMTLKGQLPPNPVCPVRSRRKPSGVDDEGRVSIVEPPLADRRNRGDTCPPPEWRVNGGVAPIPVIPASEIRPLELTLSRPSIFALRSCPLPSLPDALRSSQR
jgi:hypothetical protein